MRSLTTSRPRSAGLTSWFSSLWNKITGVFASAIDGIKSKISGVAGMLGIEMGGGEKKDGRWAADSGRVRKAEADRAGRRKTQEAGRPPPLLSRLPMVGSRLLWAACRQSLPAQAGRRLSAWLRSPPPVSRLCAIPHRPPASATTTAGRRSTSPSMATLTGGTAQQIGNTVSDTFKSGAMSPVQ